MASPTEKQTRNLDETLQRLLKLLKLPWETLVELGYGVKARTLPWSACLALGGVLAWTTVFGLDRYAWGFVHCGKIYPHHAWSLFTYRGVLETSGFWGWAIWQVALKRRLLGRLRDVFLASGLKNALGQLPGFVYDCPLGGDARRLRLSRALLPKETFVAAKSAIESGLQIYVDEIRENREDGTIDVLYSHVPMPTLSTIPDMRAFSGGELVIGMARAEQIRIKLSDVPHILVAGETASGKSTFLRQVITTLYLNNPGYAFTCVDLKGGLEFALFSQLKRVQVMSTLEQTVACLANLESEMQRRLELFAAEGVKDIDALRKKQATKKSDDGNPPQGRVKAIDRHIVVIDEIAELFLSTPDTPVRDIQKARAVVSRLARQGRAVGLHLVLGTQRPDARALDTQIKANLPGKVCFQMADTASSMVVLGNARARDLPGVPGRAIWQRGLSMTELQTPYLDPEEVEKLLAPFKAERPGQTAAPDVAHPATSGDFETQHFQDNATAGTDPLNGPTTQAKRGVVP